MHSKLIYEATYVLNKTSHLNNIFTAVKEEKKNRFPFLAQTESDTYVTRP